MFIGGGDSQSRGREFESQLGRYFLHLSKKYCLNKPRRNEKEAGDSLLYILFSNYHHIDMVFGG